MFCTNCGKEVADGAVVCLSCGLRPQGNGKFCAKCGKSVQPGQVVCLSCGSSLSGSSTSPRGEGGNTTTETNGPKKKKTAMWLSFCAGFAGKFYLGSWGWGIICCCCPIGVVVGILDGIRILNMTDEEFEAKYSNVPKDPFRW